MYLGVLLINKRVGKSMYQFLVDKMKKKLSGWKTKNLSRAAQLLLIQSTALVLPSYYMQTVRIPASTLNEMNKTIRNFLWAVLNIKRK